MRSPARSPLSRREFVTGSAAAAGSLALAHVAHAAGSDEIKLALVGCGGRGTGAVVNAFENKTHSNIRLIALADAFAEPLERALHELEGSSATRSTYRRPAASSAATPMRKPSLPPRTSSSSARRQASAPRISRRR